jgi:hypothetical protein
MNLRINFNLIEEFQIPKGSEKLASENRLKVDNLFSAVIEGNSQRIRGHDLEGLYAINPVFHDIPLF